MVSSPALLEELGRVLRYPKLARVFDDPAGIVSLVESVSVVVLPARRVSILADEEDNRLLEAAQAAGADYLVTGDHKLLGLGSFESTRIVSPREFLDGLGSEADGDQ